MRTAITFTSPAFDGLGYLEMWESYYGQYVDCINVTELAPELINNDTYVNELHNEVVDGLLGEFDTVIRVDVDEFLIPDPDKYEDLEDYLNKTTGNIRATGYNVIEMVGDKALNRTRPVLKQRDWWERDALYDKMVIVRSPVYFLNQHKTDKDEAPDEELVLAHLRDADIGDAKERFKRRFTTLSGENLTQRRQRAIKIPEKWKVI